MPAARYQNRERAARLAVFLKALSLGHTVTAAAAEAGMDRRVLYRLRAADPKFAGRWQAALDAHADGSLDPLEEEARRRALEGCEKPIYRGGTLVGHSRDYSDSMLMFLLKAKYPEKYGGRDKPAGQGDGVDHKGALDALRSKFAQKPER